MSFFSILISALLLSTAIAALRAYRAKKTAGPILLTGSVIDGKLRWNFAAGITASLLLIQIEGWSKYVLMALVWWAVSFLERDGLGRYGLKANSDLIPRDSLLGYQWVDGRPDTVDLVIAGKPEGLRFQIGRVPGGGSAQGVLDDYFFPAPDEPEQE
ncbi:hypothetical protein [Gorillibacterium sp. sgz5001074]|uniref:hypothetical protein n=1 Tax=Gorillibacterium sp. sgz5001074 TaxID=3446695 RepID=UPI003F66F820